MTEDIGWVDLEVRPDVTGFGPSLGRGLNGPLDSIGRSSGKRFGGILGKTAMGVAGGVLAAGYAAISIGKDAYAEAKEARKVGALTTSTIKATGGAANISAKQVGELSEAIMMKTAVDDEAIQTGANLLLTFKNVRNEVGAGNKIFNEATEAAVDLSAAGFGSVDSAAKMLGKTLNDPVKGITALSRAGVTFTEQQKTKIASLVEENDLLAAQKIILGEVQSQVGGAAAAQADAGDKLGVVIGNIKEDIGTALMPTIDRFADWLSDKGPAAGRKFSGWITNDAIPAIEGFVDKTRPLAKELLPAVGDALGIVKGVLADALPIAKDFVGAFNDMPGWAKKAIVGGALLGGAASKFNLLPSKQPGGGLGGLLGSMKPVPVFVTNKGFGVPGVDVPGKPGKWATAKGAVAGSVLPLTAAVAAGTAGAIAVMKLNEKFAPDAPFIGSPAPNGSATPPGTKVEDLTEFGNDFDGILKLFGAGEQAAHDYGAALEDTIPLAELLGGEVNNTGQSVSFLSDRFKALPDGVETAIKTPGLIQSRADVMDLKRKYDLTPREVQTVLRSLGYDEARNKAEAAKRAMDLLRDKTITITTRYVESGRGPQLPQDTPTPSAPPIVPRGFVGNPTPPPSKGNNAQAPRPVVIYLPDGRQLDGYMDDRINANEGLKGQRR
ncbi:MAG: hypothetical protein Q7J48_20545 [Nocardioides sp.]|nr:hypothetical protein [Nocardioides sp.]